MNYAEEITKAMSWLASDPRTLFVGQSVVYDGQALSKTFAGVPDERKIELPVVEEFQMGYCTGLALEGFIPVCCYSRWDFLILSLNQLVNHLDKIPLMSEFKPKVIIRTAVGASKPFNPGPQHNQDYTDAMRLILKKTQIFDLRHDFEVMRGYKNAFELPESVIMVEHMDAFNARP